MSGIEEDSWSTLPGSRVQQLSTARLGPGLGLSEAKMDRDETMESSTLVAGVQCHCVGLLVSLASPLHARAKRQAPGLPLLPTLVGYLI
jgi:hypothetical protein